MARLLEQLSEALQAFAACAQPPARIGGLAVNVHHVVRATTDIDFLVAAIDADSVHTALLDLGYQCIYRSDDAANYSRKDQRLDLIYAHRSYSTELLMRARSHAFPIGSIRVVSVEGLIGFKLQALLNNPSRVRDEQDIRDLLRANLDQMDMGELRKYFVLFGHEGWLSQLLEELRIEQDPP